jgi:osmoprotectant transport system ATP-binding protein
VTSYLSFKQVSKRYPTGKLAVNDVSFEIDEGEFVVLIGTSGSGKSTLLKMINRLVTPTKGTVTINGLDIQKIDATALRRQIGYVVQNIGLMPHMTVAQNMMLVPQLLKWSKQKQAEQTKKLVQLVDLDQSMLTQFPSQLSGGQQQRVGVARALAAEQKLILMDEPFGALDPITRGHIQKLVKSLQEKFHKTVLLVTHDMDEALKLATHIGVVHGGQLIQFGTPQEILRHPINEFVANLIGKERLIEPQRDRMTIAQMMTTDPVTILSDEPAWRAVEKMKTYDIETVWVVDQQHHFLGVVTLNLINDYYDQDAKVSAIYSSHAKTMTPDSRLSDIAEELLRHQENDVAVVNQYNELVGSVSRKDLVKLMYQKLWGSPVTHAEGVKNSNDNA